MTHEYRATVRWTRRDGEAFTDNRYSRGHVWSFDGGIDVSASSAPSSVPLPLSRADAVDPEEAFVASISSCHMLFFLSLAAKGGFAIDQYEDQAVGVMEKNERGKPFISRVTLNPRIDFSGPKTPSADEIADLHHRAHQECYIANSVRTEISVASIPAEA